MNLPTGKIIEAGSRLNQIDFTQKIIDLKPDFTGYFVLTVEGFDGLEEGIIFWRKGELTGAFYEFTKYSKNVYAEEALPLVFNAAAAKHGILDINALTKEQLDLVAAFNKEVFLEKPLAKKKIIKFKSTEFDEKLVRRELAGVLESKETRLEILKRFGLSKIK